MSSENNTSGAFWNSGDSRSENGTGTPPAARTAAACARASRSPMVRATSAQRLRDRGDDAEVRARADDDDGAAAAQSADRSARLGARTGRCR